MSPLRQYLGSTALSLGQVPISAASKISPRQLLPQKQVRIKLLQYKIVQSKTSGPCKVAQGSGTIEPRLICKAENHDSAMAPPAGSVQSFVKKCALRSVFRPIFQKLLTGLADATYNYMPSFLRPYIKQTDPQNLQMGGIQQTNSRYPSHGDAEILAKREPRN